MIDSQAPLLCRGIVLIEYIEYVCTCSERQKDYVCESADSSSEAR